MEIVHRLRGKGLGKIPGAKRIYKLLLPKESTLKKVKVLDFEMWIDLKDLGDLTPALVTKGTYKPQETRIIQDMIQPGMVCLDVGANIGYFATLMARLGALVRAYEPEPDNFHILLKNIELNEVQGNVIPYFGAVSNHSGEGNLSINKDYFGTHHLSNSGLKVLVTTLDNSLVMKKADFVKVDVQGAEVQVLEGMEEIIEKNKDIQMIWAFVPKCLKAFNVEPLDFLLKLEEHGFKLWDIDEKRKETTPVYAAQIARKYTKGGTNILVRR